MTTLKKLLLSSILLLSILLYNGCDSLIEPVTDLEMHFIDVGQGDSTLILTPDGYTMLIDAGDNTQGKNVVSYIRSLGINKIDVLVGTHPDADHVGGIDDIIKSFEIGDFYMPRTTHDTKTFEDVLLAAKSKGLKIKAAESDKLIAFDPETKAIFLSPENKKYSNNNAYSAVIQITYGSNKFLFTGDAEKENEKEMIKKYGNVLKSDLIKLAHHGSATSNTPEFLDIVDPEVATVSCAYKNKYSHPHSEILKYLKEKDIPLYRTDEQGTIIIYSDGENLSVDQESAGSYTYRKGN
ncbi:ComEC/Rec2 family competence protein [Proteocatella sphenisci]|uniref:ComEC/Rec2 family competence protein n=1 Tax=Proteocatella sphenisci TaxID=181070 RepID=UPI00048D3053|nr:ComEC/Rec2 family competence protein [Proteocatella sphenisci]